MNSPKSKQPYDIGSWYTQIGRLKRAYTSLANSDLNYEEGQKGMLVAALVIKLSVPEKDILDVMSRTKKIVS